MGRSLEHFSIRIGQGQCARLGRSVEEGYQSTRNSRVTAAKVGTTTHAKMEIPRYASGASNLSATLVQATAPLPFVDGAHPS